MSFSAQIKNELTRVRLINDCCKKAELSALLKLDGSFHILGKGKFAIHTSTENAAVARETVRLLSELFALEHEVVVRRSYLRKMNNYVVYVPSQPSLNQALNELGILDDKMIINSGIIPRIVRKDCCAVSYLRGAFLGGGSMSDPIKGYHFELNTDNEQLAYDLLSLFKRFELNAKLSFRKKNYVIYIKEGQGIVNLLAIVGAHQTLLNLEDLRIVKDMRNEVNRLVNCDTANLDKTVKAALLQLEDIAFLDEEVGLSRLPLALNEIARKRLLFPQANLRELGESCEPPLSKSAVYSRIRRIKKLAKKLGK
ncbi:DNA-binding protein WhiA [Candidatus Oleimmundimicrobium sp.]|uniref:DNA-binding protein WhiA n=1 Tax=Candidatus Oleimmundimicrobium sp. TaxID=3060597 RepID=UPI002724BE8B|nr:DNA-binding protein WhiA [Candidatus Oleimmundimicrobium sp.]MDO8885710.1 DNA-binding protein WhiA [Candidatus Oleimmundimicrobium sp.]